jgi:hypothetical protein
MGWFSKKKPKVYTPQSTKWTHCRTCGIRYPVYMSKCPNKANHKKN